jgi:hypothetical protein
LNDIDALIEDLDVSIGGGVGMDALTHCPASMFRDWARAAATSKSSRAAIC